MLYLSSLKLLVCPSYNDQSLSSAPRKLLIVAGRDNENPGVNFRIKDVEVADITPEYKGKTRVCREAQ